MFQLASFCFRLGLLYGFLEGFLEAQAVSPNSQSPNPVFNRADLEVGSVSRKTLRVHVHKYLHPPKPAFCGVPTHSISGFIVRTYEKVSYGSFM